WADNRQQLLSSSNQILSLIKQQDNISGKELNSDIIQEAVSQFEKDFDKVYGGFGNAPKFPTPHNLSFLLRYWYKTRDKSALEIVEKTLDSMYRGVIYDHIGFGFSRYSTDRKWLVPHFEKMLYDNALLAIAYLETYQAVKNPEYRDIAEQIFTYVLRDMTSKEGGFYSAEDADSEGEEGKFYVWTHDEIRHILGDEEGDKFCKYFNITHEGNFEGRNIPNLINSDLNSVDQEFIKRCRGKLFNYREKRVHPYKDDKILTSWNGLMIAAMAIGGRVLKNNEYIIAAEKAAGFIFKNLKREDGRLMARYRDGDASIPAYIDDYAFLIWGLIEIYETTYNPEYLKMALDLNSDLIKYFWDSQNGGLFVYGSDSEQLITRPKEIYDGATPSGNSVSALNFLRLARLTGMYDLEEKSQQLLKSFGKSIESYPKGHSCALTALLFINSPGKEIVIASDNINEETKKMTDIINEEFRPFAVSMLYAAETKDIEKLVPFIADYKSVNGKPAAYICEKFSCQAPVTDAKVFRKILES
ncbi:MAG: thioredoxin domain-containing protein, partial [Bacillota bacterium]|nr:thioredoxin domain-containing protein [Bacillota bacterium]